MRVDEDQWEIIKISILFLQLDAKKEHLNLGFYLGQTDSCQGDSGGPFYVFIGKT